MYRCLLSPSRNKLNLALADNKLAIKIDGNWNTFFSRGVTHYKMENFQKAINDFDNSIRLNPSVENAYLYRASVRLITSCDLRKVLEDYYSVTHIEDIDDEIRMFTYNSIAWILATTIDESVRDRKEALLFAKASVEIQANCQNLDTLAVAFAECGKFEEAIDTHKKAVEVCKLNNPELIPDLEEHLKNYMLKIKNGMSWSKN